MKGMRDCRVYGVEIDDRGDLDVCVVWGFHNRLLVMLLARSVMISIMTHHSVGLKEPPNIRYKYMAAHIAVRHMNLAADLALTYVCPNAAPWSAF